MKEFDPTRPGNPFRALTEAEIALVNRTAESQASQRHNDPLNEQDSQFVKKRRVTNGASGVTKVFQACDVVTSVQIYTAKELLAEKLAPIRWVVPGLLAEGATILASKPKVGKSFMMLGVCLAVAHGGKALGYIDVEKAETLYIDVDGDIRDTQARFRRMTGGNVPDGFYIAFSWPTIRKGGLDHLNRFLDDHPLCAVVVIDVMAGLRDGEDKLTGRRLYDVEREEATYFRLLAQERNIAVVLVHHCNKISDSEDPFDMISGSTGLVGGVHNAAVLRDHSSGNIVYYTRGRTQPRAELMLRPDFELGTFVLEGDAVDFVSSYQQRQILDAVTQGFANPREVTDYTGLPYDSVRHMLVRLVKARKLVRRGRGNYALPPISL